MAKSGPNSAPEIVEQAPPEPVPAALAEPAAGAMTADERAEAFEAATVSMEDLKSLPVDARVAVAEASAYVRAHLPNPIVEPEGE